MSIQLLIQRDGQRAMTQVEPSEWEGPSPHQQAWIRMTSPSPAELKQFAELANAPGAGVELLTQTRNLPDYVVGEGWLFVALQVLALSTASHDKLDIGMLILDDVLISVETAPNGLVPQLVEWAERTDTQEIDDVDELPGRLSIIVGRRYLAIADELNRRSDDLYERALITRRGVLSDIQVQRRVAGIVHTKVRRQRTVIDNIVDEDPPVCSEAGLRLLLRGRDAHSEAIDSLSAVHNVLADALDAYRGASADRQSTATTILAVYSAVLLPLTLIASWYGMNVKLPGQDFGSSWVVIMVVMAIIALISMAIFWRAGFIRVATHKVRPQPPSDFVRSVLDAIPVDHTPGQKTISSRSPG